MDGTSSAFSKNPPLLVDVQCTFRNSDGVRLACESSNFTELEINTCEIDVSYTYSVMNKSEKDAKLNYLFDETLREIVVDTGSDIILENNVVKKLRTTGVIDVCQGDDEITKKVLAIASPIDDSSENLPYAEDILTIQPP